jgi:hypothetical protein
MFELERERMEGQGREEDAASVYGYLLHNEQAVRLRWNREEWGPAPAPAPPPRARAPPRRARA